MQYGGPYRHDKDSVVVRLSTVPNTIFTIFQQIEIKTTKEEAEN